MIKTKELFAYVCVQDAAKAIQFYQEAFGATEKFRLTEPSGRIGHAELQFGNATLMLSDEFPEYGISRPNESGGKSFQLHIHVENADETIKRVIGLGANVIHEITNQFYGERSGTIKDPFGLQWNIGHHIEEVSPSEMQRRYDEMMKKA